MMIKITVEAGSLMESKITAAKVVDALSYYNYTFTKAESKQGEKTHEASLASGVVRIPAQCFQEKLYPFNAQRSSIHHI